MASENEVLEQDDVKSRALMRLGVAGVVTAAALGALWWLDQDRKPEAPKPAAPAPIVTAPPRDAIPPVDEATPQPPAAPTAPAAGPETTPDVAPPPAAASPAATTSSSPASPSREAPPPPKVSSVPKAPSPAPAQPARTEAPAAALPGERYIVQLGVFSDPGHALDLVNKLKKQGVQARTETRVQLGPFNNRAEADKAMEALRKLGLSGMVTAATK